MHRGVCSRAGRPDVEAQTQRCVSACGVSRELNRSKGGDMAISWPPLRLCVRALNGG